MGSSTQSVRSRGLARELQPKVLVPSALAGLVAGLLVILIEISFGALVFSGDLSGHVSSGIGLALYGALAIGLVTALTSSFPGTVALPQDSPAAILALMSAAIATAMAALGAPEETLATVVAAIGVTSLLAGALFLVLGQFNLGALIRYVPYPVIGGFLAGTGWLLLRGTVGMMTGAEISLLQIPALLQPSLLLRWLPGLLFAVVLLVILRRFSHFLIIPSAVVAAVGLFYLVLWLTGTSLVEARAEGWLLGPFPGGALWPPLSLSALARVHWEVVLGQAGNIVTILVISVLSLLLNTGGLELTVRRDIDLNRELRSAGLANAVAGLGGGLTGYQALSLSALGNRMGADSRLVGMVSATLCGVMLFFGAPVLSLFPMPVLGGLLLFLALAFLVEWVYDSWFMLSKADYGIVIVILIAMNTLGVLAGVGLGVAFAVALFVLSYSRISVIKHTLSGTNFQSNVDRSRRDRQTLVSKGDWLELLELQGFVFFGTANGLFEQVRTRTKDPHRPSPRFIVLDFRRVSGLDASAVSSFAKMVQLAQAQEIVLVFTHLSEEVRGQLAREVLTDEASAVWRVEIDLDHGVEWCEEQILCMAAEEGGGIEPPSPEGAGDAAEWLAALSSGEGGRPEAPIPESIATRGLTDYLVRMEAEAGHVLIQQGDPPRGLYFVAAGQVTAQRDASDGRTIRLRKMGPGTVVGEMGLYLDTAASASVITNQTSVVYFLSVESLRQMEEARPEMAIALHREIARLLSERVARANRTIQALLAGPEGAGG